MHASLLTPSQVFHHLKCSHPYITGNHHHHVHDIKTALLEWSLSNQEDDDDIVGFCQQEAAAAGI